MSRCPECDVTHEAADCGKVRFVLQAEGGNDYFSYIIDNETKGFIALTSLETAEVYMQRLNQNPELAKSELWTKMS